MATTTTTGTARAAVPAVTRRLRALTAHNERIAAGRMVHNSTRSGTLRRTPVGMTRRAFRARQRWASAAAQAETRRAR